MEDKSTKKQVPATFWLGVLAKSPTIEVNGKSVSGVQPVPVGEHFCIEVLCHGFFSR